MADPGTTPEVPLLGRDDEIALLRRTADRVRDEGSARIVSLVGPNGVGKTTVIDQALADLSVGGSGRRFRVYRGTGRESALGYGALVSLLRNRFGLSEGTNLEDAQALLRGQVSKVLDDRKVGDVCFFLGQILDVPFPDSPLTKALRDDPQEGRMLRRAVIKSFFEADAARSPICLVLDDLDAAGEDSIALVSYLAEHVKGPMLLVCSMRPEMAVAHPGWPKLGGDRHVRIDMGAVDAEIARRVMRALLAPTEGGVPELLVDAGVRLAGGNLGLLRALIQIFRDCGVLEATAGPDGALRYRAHLERLEDVELPVNVDETVAMRVAALAPAERQLLERAAAMGKVFWAGALVVLERADRKPPAFWELAETSEVDTIEGLLASLEDRGYVARTPSSSFPGETQLAFCHQRERQHLGALTPPDRRAAHHLAIAEWLRLRQPDPPTREHLVLLAYHLDLGGAAVRAGLTYLDAADSARESYAARDAVAQYERGLELLGEAEALRRVDAIHHLGEVLQTLGRTDDALRAYRDMLALAYRLDLPEKGGTAHDRLGRLYRATGALPEAQRHLETALALFESVEDARGVAACHDDVGLLLWTKGDYEDALRRLRTALELRKGLGERRAIAQSLHNVGMVLRDFGRPQKAQEALDAALVIRREEGDLIGVAQTLDGLGQLAGDQRDLERARELFRRAHEVAAEVGERHWIAIILTNLGEVHYRLGDNEESVRILTEAEELCDALGDKLHQAEAKRGLAKAYLLRGDLKRARGHIKQAVDLFGQIRSKAHLAAALRTLGEVTAAGAWGPSHEGKAVDYFLRSIALCKEIGNEIETAKSYRCFSDYVSASAHYRHNDGIQAEAKKLREMGDEIFARQKVRAEQGDP